MIIHGKNLITPVSPSLARDFMTTLYYVLQEARVATRAVRHQLANHMFVVGTQMDELVLDSASNDEIDSLKAGTNFESFSSNNFDGDNHESLSNSSKNQLFKVMTFNPK